MVNKTIDSVIISRTDHLGDVTLTLPIAGIIKQKYPDCTIYFLGRKYTEALVQTSKYVDHFLNWDEISQMSENEQILYLKKINSTVIIHVLPNKQIARIAHYARIPLRIATSHRLYNWLYCNKRVGVSRKKSDLHEAQLNIKLLAPIQITGHYSLEQLPDYYGLDRVQTLKPEYMQLLDNQKFNLLLHPKSKGNGREWGLANFSELIYILPPEKFKIFVTGSADEGVLMRDWLVSHKDRVHDLTGQFDLHQFISFIQAADGLVASGTGPVHIAAALGRLALGLYPPMRPIHPGRWAPVGYNAHYLVINKECNKCRHDNVCLCMQSITPKMVLEKINSVILRKMNANK